MGRLLVQFGVLDGRGPRGGLGVSCSGIRCAGIVLGVGCSPGDQGDAGCGVGGIVGSVLVTENGADGTIEQAEAAPVQPSGRCCGCQVRDYLFVDQAQRVAHDGVLCAQYGQGSAVMMFMRPLCSGGRVRRLGCRRWGVLYRRSERPSHGRDLVSGPIGLTRVRTEISIPGVPRQGQDHRPGPRSPGPAEAFGHHPLPPQVQRTRIRPPNRIVFRSELRAAAATGAFFFELRHDLYTLSVRRIR